MVSGTEDDLRFVIIHHPEGQIESMRTDIDKRPAALFSSSKTRPKLEPLFSVRHEPWQNKYFRVHRLRILVSGKDCLHGIGYCIRSSISCLCASRFPSSAWHPRPFCHRLLAHDMLTCFKGSNGNFGMRVIRRQNMNDIDALILADSL